ncbi:hypothetical protein P9112_013046 [Eukaryota sp. TZLM1-RC]
MSVALRESAAVSSLRNAFFNRCCAHCFKLRASPDNVAECENEVFCDNCSLCFCSSTCHNTATYHSFECDCFHSLTNTELDADRELIRIVIRALELKNSNSHLFDQILSLPTFPTKFSDLTSDLKEHYGQVAEYITQYIPSDHVSNDVILTLCHVVNCNAFGLQDSLALGIFDVGIGLFPKLSTIPHSCVPNAVLSPVKGKSFEIRRLDPHDTSSNITISKLSSLALPLLDRREELNSMGIDCQCPRCIDSEVIRKEAKYYGWICQSCREGLLEESKETEDLFCLGCGKVTRKEAISDLANKMVQFIHLGNSQLRRTEWKLVQATFEKLLSEYSRFITKEASNNALIRLPLMVALENLGLFDDACSHGAAALDFVRALHPENHPKVAEVCHQLGEVYLSKAKYLLSSKPTLAKLVRKQGRNYLEEAVRIRSICFGENHRVTNESRKYLK